LLRVRGLLRRNLGLDQRPGRQLRLAKVSHAGTASPGGVCYVYGEAVAQILTQKLGIAVKPLPTQEPVHNVKLIESAEHNWVWSPWEWLCRPGKGWATGKNPSIPCARSFPCTTRHFNLPCFVAPESPAWPCSTKSHELIDPPWTMSHQE
jgi:hypothetical protein